jgi:hypothetical protein
LFLAVVFLLPNNNISQTEINLSEVYSDLLSFQEAIHQKLLNGKIPNTNAKFIENLNIDVSESSGTITTAKKDAWQNPYTIIIDPHYVKIISNGQDKEIFTDDDISLITYISYNDTGYSIISNSSFIDSCYHSSPTSATLQLGDCLTNMISTETCSGCNYLKTFVTLANGHDFSITSNCEESICLKCGASNVKELEHLFVVMNPSETTLAEIGSCNVRNSYYYTCAYCPALSEKTYEYDYELSVHDTETIESRQFEQGVEYLSVLCKGCNYEFLTASITSYEGNYDGKPHSILVETTANVTYYIDKDNSTSVAPEYTLPGRYNIPIKISMDQYSIESVANVFINDVPEIMFNNLNNTSFDNPYLSSTAQFVLSGYVNDEHAVKSVTINGETAKLNQNEWSFEIKLYKGDVFTANICVTDIYGGTVTSVQYIAYDLSGTLENDINGAIVSEETWHVSTTNIVIDGYTNPNVVNEITVNDEDVLRDPTGYWYKEVTVLENTVTTIIVKTVDSNGFAEQRIIYVCHSNEKPTWKIDEYRVEASKIYFELFNPSGSMCNSILSVTVNGSALPPVIRNDITMNIPGINGGILCYYKDDTRPFLLDISIPIISNNEDIVIDVVMTHGEHYCYLLDLLWFEEYVNPELTIYYFVGIDVIETNLNTGETNISHIRPPE